MSWFYRVDVGRDASGKRIQKQKEGRTRREADRAMRELKRDLDNGTYIPSSRTILAQYLEEWKADHVTHNVRDSTAKEYRRIIDRYIVPQLGNHRMQDLKSHHIQGYVSRMLKSGRVRGEGGLSPTTVRNHFRVLSEALKHAVDMDIIKTNPADRVKLPKVDKFEPEIVTTEVARKILDEPEGTPWHTAFHLAFCNDRGVPFNPSSFSHAFRRMAGKAGYPNVRLHDTRHAHATILLGAEVHPKVVQERHGHSTIVVAMGI